MMEACPVRVGTISPLLRLDEFAIRALPQRLDMDETEVSSGSELVCQGHLANASSYPVENVRIDVSYYDHHDRFLGLDKTGIFDVAELAPGERLPFDIRMHLPDGTFRCQLNATAKRKGFFSSRMF